MQRWKLRGAVLVLVGWSLLLGGCRPIQDGYWPAVPLGREQYGILVRNDFAAAYAAAVAGGESWVTDPIQVGLRLAGHEHLLGDEPDRIHLFRPAADQAIVVVIAGELGDDSVSDSEIRADLVRDAGVWRVVWAGHRERCYRGPVGWTTELCP